MFILLLARLPNACLLLVQLLYDPFSEVDIYARVKMNTELKIFLIKLSPLENVVLLVPRWFVEIYQL